MDVWQPGPGREIILNLPCTVERSTPNVYADQIEWMSRNLSAPRARLPVRAHAQRPRHRGRRRRAGRAGRRRPGRGLPVRQRRADRQRLPGHPRPEPVQPGHRPDDRLLRHRRDPAHRRVLQPARRSTRATPTPATWSTPRSPAPTRTRSRRASRRLEADAAAAGVPGRRVRRGRSRTCRSTRSDVGRTYEAVIRVNSQSGKGGVAYIMKAEHQLDLPRRLQIEFSRVVQASHRRRGRRGRRPAQMWEVFAAEYLAPRAGGRCSPTTRPRWWTPRTRSPWRSASTAQERQVEGAGNGPISAFCDALGSLGIDVRVLDYAEHALTAGSDAQAAAYVECEIGGEVWWGVGIDTNTVTASLRAVLSAVNRARAAEPAGPRGPAGRGSPASRRRRPHRLAGSRLGRYPSVRIYRSASVCPGRAEGAGARQWPGEPLPGRRDRAAHPEAG